jgi:hypothetical protein
MATMDCMKRAGMILAALAVAVLAGAAQGGSADLYFTVVRDSDGKPVRNASVVLHEVRPDGRQQRGGVQLKTNAEGKTEFRGAPHGRLRIQVIASGFRTFGQDYDIDEAKHEFEIKLERPRRQHSIYE